MNKLKVLIADSTVSVRQFIKYELENHFPGVVIEMASNGKNIQQRLEITHYDLILYEKEMPMLDGNTLLEWLRKHETLKTVPFMMMSSSGDEEGLKTAVRLGADAYLLKPFKADALVQKITAVVNKLNRRKAVRYSAEGEFILKTSTLSFRGNLADVSMEGLSGLIDRQDQLPHILEKVEASITLSNKSRIEGIAGYIIRMEAVEAEYDIKYIKIAVKFIEGLTPAKKDELGRFFSSLAG